MSFRVSQPAGIHVRVLRGRAVAADYAFAARAGAVTAGPLVLTPAAYTIRITATDGFGRNRALTWRAVLPG